MIQDTIANIKMLQATNSSRRNLSADHSRIMQNRVSMNFDPQNNRVDGGSGLNLLNYDKNAVKKNTGKDVQNLNQPSVAWGDKQIPIPNDSSLQIISRPGKVKGSNAGRQTKKGFGRGTALMVKALNDVHIEHREESTSLGAPAVPFESLTLEQAFSENRKPWEESLLDELKSLEKNETFEILKMNQSMVNERKLISYRRVLRNKFSADGSIARRKSRIVGKGYEKEHGIDYFETFATVVRYATLRAVFSCAIINNIELDHLDADTAFLNRTLKEPNYLGVPEYFHLLKPWIKGSENKYYLKLNKALYGLKQLPREWFLEVKRYFNDIGFKQGDADPNLFISSSIREKKDLIFIM
ncbi:hypothetical protein K3495_g12811 [Podosphaera aphanis]|nr:hypothetical protein K3495_g12811 [Podosphaera aphanis]